MAADLNHGIKRDGFIIHRDRLMRAATLRFTANNKWKANFTHPVVTVKWCCTAGACLPGLQWERRQQQGYLGPQSPGGSPLPSAGPAIPGRPPPCSPRSAGTCTWSSVGRSVSSAGTSPPANSSRAHWNHCRPICPGAGVSQLTRWSNTLKASRARSGY